MKNLTLENLARACQGEYFGDPLMSSSCISSITTDSREIKPQGLFIPIVGARADGHDYIETVMAKGALCTLTEKELGAVSFPYIKVTSSLQAVKDIAEFYLKQLRIPVIGITGSVGKTSTKEMIAAVLEQKYRVCKTQGNFNNELGLPLTVFNLCDEDQIAVLEMGISEFGEMRRLAKVARPDTCVITNIGQCHLENLGDRDGVLKAKAEIFEYLREDGRIILNGDDDKLAGIGQVRGIKPVFFGVVKQTHFFADQIENHGLSGISCRIHAGRDNFHVKIPIPGMHMVYNALAGTAVGCAYGVSLPRIKKAIEGLRPLGGRFNIIETGKYTIVDDCYNANPVSMRASLEVLQDGCGRKTAILGDMGELGSEEIQCHKELGRFIGSCEIDMVACVGPLSRYVQEGIREVNAGLQVIHMEQLAELLERLPELVHNGDTILVKASHFMEFDKVVKKLEQRER